ncbi:MAG TPA: S46 family peptidase [Terriglobales bacterium]|jgi:hypothetical protein|nr:S46 family peptidase [Terriglobales bacterium]
MRFRILPLLCILGFLAGSAAADEGMWLFNAAPKAKIKAKYGFEVTDAWLNHLQLSSIRFDNGGSGAFVSADGLALTNHHVASDCLQNLSTPRQDYRKTGFYAKSPEQEPRCPDLELNVVQQITDVTAQVNTGVKPGMPDADAGKLQRASMAAIEKECATAADIRCDVVTLYSGAQFHLYKYKKYTDVRLVFAPEVDIAFFGGDPDNFEFPRYDLDVAFFRVYENGKPAHLADYLQISKLGAQEGDLVFVSGNPGHSERQDTVNQFFFLKTTQYPFVLKDYERRIRLLQDFSAQSAENARIAQEDIFILQNSFKAYSGFNATFSDQNLLHRKIMDERIHLIRTQNSTLGKREFVAYMQIDKALRVHHEIFLPYRFLELRYGFRGTLAGFARTLVRVAGEKSKPNGERLREYRDSALPSLEAELFSSAPIYKSLETVMLADSLKEMQEQLGADNATVVKVLLSKTPEEVARNAIANSKLDDIAFRKHLYEGGTAAIAGSNDPLIVMMREVDPDARALRKRYDSEVDSVIQENGAAIAKSRFMQMGLYLQPDATFTLRLSYGQVKGYTEDGRGYLAKGTKVAPFTDMAGAFDYASEHGNKPPYALPDSWLLQRKKIQLKTPLNFVSTVDILGGSSGSPVVNKDGELVGVIFDGNVQSLAWRFMYEDYVGRGVSVDSRSILEALRTIYKAEGLVKELTRTEERGGK